MASARGKLNKNDWREQGWDVLWVAAAVLLAVGIDLGWWTEAAIIAGVALLALVRRKLSDTRPNEITDSRGQKHAISKV